MSNAQILLSAVAVMVLCWGSSAALVCYDCTFCNEPRGNKTCPDGTLFCYTDHTVIFGKNITWRGCSDNKNGSCDVKLNKWGYDGITSCRCSGNLCNSESFSRAHSLASASLSAIFVLSLVASKLLN